MEVDEDGDLHVHGFVAVPTPAAAWYPDLMKWDVGSTHFPRERLDAVIRDILDEYDTLWSEIYVVTEAARADRVSDDRVRDLRPKRRR